MTEFSSSVSAVVCPEEGAVVIPADASDASGSRFPNEKKKKATKQHDGEVDDGSNDDHGRNRRRVRISSLRRKKSGKKKHDNRTKRSSRRRQRQKSPSKLLQSILSSNSLHNVPIANEERLTGTLSSKKVMAQNDPPSCQRQPVKTTSVHWVERSLWLPQHSIRDLTK